METNVSQTQNRSVYNHGYSRMSEKSLDLVMIVLRVVIRKNALENHSLNILWSKWEK